MVNVRRAEVAEPDPRCQGARRPLGERRVRGCQERAGLRRGSDPDPGSADQERHDHRRAALHGARPDRLDRHRRQRRRQGDVHDRGLDRGLPPRRAHLERVAGRTDPAGSREGGQGPRARSRRRLQLLDRQHPLARRTPGEPGCGRDEDPMDWADEARPLGSDPQVRVDNKTPSGTVATRPGSLRLVPAHPRYDHPRSPGPRSPRPPALRRRRHGPDGRPWPCTPDPHLDHENRVGRSPMSRTRSPTGTPSDARRSRPGVHRHVRRARYPPGPLLLDERDLPDRGDGSFIRTALDRADRVREIYRRWRTSSTPTSPASVPGRRRGRGKVGDDDRDPLGRRSGSSTSAGRPR